MKGGRPAVGSQPIFLDYDQAELDRQYDHLKWVPDAKEIMARYGTLSDEVAGGRECHRDVAYGPSPGQRLDIFPTAGAGPAPVHLFLHGGQWQRMSKEESAFPAAALTEAGAIFVAVNFDLIPNVSLDEIVRQNREAVAWMVEHAAEFGGDPRRIYVSGHSSGAHITAMLATTDWAEFGFPTYPLRGITCISGTYDMDPLMKSFRGAYLKLDREGIERNSPIHRAQRVECPVIVSYGSLETDEFRRQGDSFAAAVRAAGKPCDFVPMEGFNHFSVGLELANPASPLTQAMFAQMEL